MSGSNPRWQPAQSLKRVVYSLNLLRRALHVLNKSGTSPWVFVVGFIGAYVAVALEAVTVTLLIPISENIVQTHWSPKQLHLIRGWNIEIPARLASSPRDLFFTLLAAYFFLFLLKKTIEFSTGESLNRSCMKALVNLRTQLMTQSMQFGKGYYDKTPYAHVLDIILAQAQAVTMYIPLTAALLSSAAYALTYGLILLKISVPLTLLVILLVPWFSVVSHKIRVTIQALSERMNYRNLDLFVKISDTYNCLALVRENDQQNAEITNLRKRFEESTALYLKIARIHATLPMSQEVFSILIFVCLLSTTEYLAAHFNTPRGTEYLLFLFILRRAHSSLNQLGNGLAECAHTAGVLDRVEKLMDLSDKAIVPSGNFPFQTLSQTIEIRNLSFSYPGGEFALKNISFTARKGEMTALVGKSGAGKSTLIQLIQRLYDVAPSTLFVDGRDIRDYTIASLRRNIAVVSQDNYLFNDSIRYNLLYGCEKSVSDSELFQVLEKVALADFVAKLPGGLDCLIGERGARLSGGEKQRLALARAILKQAPILLLDEATSGLDSLTERVISKSVEGLFKGQTVIVIAHRLSTVMKAKHIVVLERGEVMEAGSVEQLLNNKREFYELFHSQRLAA